MQVNIPFILPRVGENCNYYLSNALASTWPTNQTFKEKSVGRLLKIQSSEGFKIKYHMKIMGHKD